MLGVHVGCRGAVWCVINLVYEQAGEGNRMVADRLRRMRDSGLHNELLRMTSDPDQDVRERVMTALKSFQGPERA